MTVRSKATISAELLANIADNTSGNDTPALVRQVVQDIIDSYLDGSGSGLGSVAIPIAPGGGAPPAWVITFGDVTLGANGFMGISNKAGFLYGLTLAAAGGTSTFTVASGWAMDQTNSYADQLMLLANAMGKTTAAWAAGGGKGALDTGAIANSTWYHVHLIANQVPNPYTVDVLISLSASAPNLPTGYTIFRRIGSMKTDGSGNWVAFKQIGDDFLLALPVADVNGVSLGTTPTLYTLSVPPGVQVVAKVRGYFYNATPSVLLLVSSPDETSGAVNGVPGNLTAVGQLGNTAVALGDLNVRTDTSSRIRAVTSAASSVLYIATVGWTDRRGRV